MPRRHISKPRTTQVWKRTSKNSNTFDRIVSKLREAGYNDYEISGIVGNFIQESGYNFNMFNDARKGYAHMTTDDYNLMKKLYKDELDYYIDWMNGNVNNAYSKNLGYLQGQFKPGTFNNTYDPTNLFLTQFERAVKKDKNGKVIGYQNQDERRQFAGDVYNQLLNDRVSNWMSQHGNQMVDDMRSEKNDATFVDRNIQMPVAPYDDPNIPNTIERTGAMVQPRQFTPKYDLDKVIQPFQQPYKAPVEYGDEATGFDEGKNPDKHVVKKGDSLWAISRKYGISIPKLRKYNEQIKGDLIRPGDQIRIKPEMVSTLVDVNEEWKNEEQYNRTNTSAIKHAKHNSNYAIVDKDSGTITVFDKKGNQLYQSDKISTGVSGDDYNTVTYTDEKGNILSGQGNESTPAGILRISGVGEYHGYPSFQRARLDSEGNIRKVPELKKVNGKWVSTGNMVDDNVASSMHYGNVSKKKNSNGCIRVDGKTLEELAGYLGIGDDIYTLPTNDNSRFTLTGGKLNFTAKNPYGITKPDPNNVSKDGRDKTRWDDYNVTINKQYSPLLIVQKNPTDNFEHDGNALEYANSLSVNKEALQKKFGLTSNEYNRLAQLAMGIAEQESKFGTSSSYRNKNAIADTIGDWAINASRGAKAALDINKKSFYDWASNIGTRTAMARSRGISQIKMEDDNLEMQQIYKDLKINTDNIEQPGVSAIATLARLAHIYNNEIKGGSFKRPTGDKIDKYDALLYKYTGKHAMLKNGKATPLKNKYIQSVKQYMNNFDYYEEREEEK